MKNWPFSIMVDGRNDTGLEKMLPITVRIFDVNFGRVMPKFFDMNLLSGRDSGTAEVMLDSTDAQFTKQGVSWENVSGLGVDNTNANIGTRNSLKARVLRKNAEVVIAGCPCHILHNAAGKASEAFAAVSEFDLENYFADFFNWFERSAKRKSILKEYYNFCDVDCQEVIKYICIRWLCTERCVNRELKKYPSLRSYFRSENERDQRFVRLHETFSDPVTEVCMHFYQSVLPTLTNFNKFLQTDEPLIQCLYDQIQSFMNKLASKFIKPEVIQQLKQKGSSFTKWNISLENQKSGPDLTAGILTKALLAKLLDDGDILENSSDCFCDGVRAFYKTACEYCGKWLPADDTLHKNCRFLDFFKRNTISFDCLTEILALFPNSFDSL